MGTCKFIYFIGKTTEKSEYLQRFEKNRGCAKPRGVIDTIV